MLKQNREYFVTLWDSEVLSTYKENLVFLVKDKLVYLFSSIITVVKTIKHV